MTQNLRIGQQVENFGEIGTVEAFHPITGDPILRDQKGRKWLADAAKCTPLEGGIIHPDALVRME